MFTVTRCAPPAKRANVLMRSYVEDVRLTCIHEVDRLNGLIAKYEATVSACAGQFDAAVQHAERILDPPTGSDIAADARPSIAPGIA